MINQVFLVGHIGKEVDVRTFESGNKVARFALATSKNVKRNEEWVKETVWHNITLWGKLADLTDKFATKGGLVAVVGELENESYTKQDGNKINKSVVVATKVHFLSKKDEASLSQQKPEEVTLPPVFEPLPSQPLPPADDDYTIPF